jgi:sporulation protein YlmC with PRC-barrel domain
MEHQESQLNESPSRGLVYLSKLRRLPVRIERGGGWLGKVDDIVVTFDDLEVKVVGIVLACIHGDSNQFIPWERIVDLFRVGIIVMVPEHGDRYPPFQPRPDWALGNDRLIGRKIGSMEGPKIGSINDLIFEIHENHLHLKAVDASINGPLRSWGLGRLAGFFSEKLLPWYHVLPFLRRFDPGE